MSTLDKFKKFAGQISALAWAHQCLKINKLNRQFRIDYERFKELTESNKRFDLDWADKIPCLYENTSTAEFDRHYVFHLAWAARKVADLNPKLHIDISSSLYFCTMLSAFIPVRFYDYRPVPINLSNLTAEKGDLTRLPFNNSSIDSLSCMHVVEHIGLGRYGDSLNPDGDVQAISELKRVLAVGGTLLFVVPIGRPKIMFNAHRIYSYSQIESYFSELQLMEFSLIPDSSSHEGLILNADPERANSQTYGCGCFLFRKRKDFN